VNGVNKLRKLYYGKKCFHRILLHLLHKRWKNKPLFREIIEHACHPKRIIQMLEYEAEL